MSEDAAESPLSQYRRWVASGKIQADPRQALTVEKLQSLHNALIHYQPSSGLSGWKARFGLSRRRQEPPQGIYLYGGVGRGKSMLMDLFFATAPLKAKRRSHFHAFMQDMHQRLGRLRRQKKKPDDPIASLADSVADETCLLCFDEFQVLDITDALILGRLFEALFERGVVIAATSNRPPRDLYKDGLQRDRFLPFIALLEERLDVVHLDGANDYRLNRIKAMRVYLAPRDDPADRLLEAEFRLLTNNGPIQSDEIEVHGRKLVIKRVSNGVAFVRFDDLCRAPLGPADYLTIAGRYHTLFMAGIPKLSVDERDEAKRFATLIDALYEQKVNLLCTADVGPRDIYTHGQGVFEFQRTASRLIEMQSSDYLEQPHRTSE